MNTSITSPGSPGTSGTYYLLPVIEHEIDEVLGLGSSLPIVPNSTIFPEDLFRYDPTGARTFTSTSGVTAFFSIDDVNALAQFHNNLDGADFGDWESGLLPKVQDAFATPGANPALGVELTALDVIGYDRVMPPSITLQPTNQTVIRGHNAQFAVAASGTPAPTYQWQVSSNGGSVWFNLSNVPPYSGVTTTTLTIAGVFRALNGNQYRAVATNTVGTATSNVATLTLSLTITPSDFDGDGKTDVVSYRPANGTLYVLQSSTNYTTYASYVWGVPGDMSLRGDFDGDGIADVAMYRPSNGTWYILLSSTNYTTYISYLWGVAGDVPVPADYDPDGRADVAAYRPSTGTWYFLQSSTNYTPYASYLWGLAGDIPLLRRP